MNIETFEFKKIKYVVIFPDNFDKNQKYPLIFKFHGAGGRGNDITPLLRDSAFLHQRKNFSDFPFMTIMPLCHENTWFDMWEQLKEFVLYTTTLPNVDKERIYLMGASMGGYATWAMAMSTPDIFAAIVPICGGGMYWNAARLVNVPIWAFHGAKDDVVLLRESEIMVQRVNEFGGNAKLTIYPENEHNSWDATFSNPEVYEWLLSHKNENASQIIDIYNDIKKYG